MLLCKLKYKNIDMYRVVIPDILSHSFVYLCHRHFMCIKGNKLFNQIKLKFEIRNLDQIISFVVKNCNNCSLTAKIPCGTNRHLHICLEINLFLGLWMKFKFAHQRLKEWVLIN